MFYSTFHLSTSPKKRRKREKEEQKRQTQQHVCTLFPGRSPVSSQQPRAADFVKWETIPAGVSTMTLATRQSELSGHQVENPLKGVRVLFEDTSKLRTPWVRKSSQPLNRSKVGIEEMHPHPASMYCVDGLDQPLH